MANETNLDDAYFFFNHCCLISVMLYVLILFLIGQGQRGETSQETTEQRANGREAQTESNAD